jgi:hypothetical protein
VIITAIAGPIALATPAVVLEQGQYLRFWAAAVERDRLTRQSRRRIARARAGRASAPTTERRGGSAPPGCGGL